MNTPCSLFFALNKEYLQHATTALCSVLSHFESEQELDVYFLGEDLKQTDLAPVRELAPIHPFRLRLICPDLSRFQGLPDLKGTKVTYFRLMIPELFPELDTAVYLDSDVIAERDIAPLWSIVPREFSLAAVPENRRLPFIQARKNDLGIPADQDYFNAGVLWMNLKKMREIRFSEKAGTFIREHPEKIVFHDQDILNALLRNDWYPLPRHWNYLTSPENCGDREYRASLTEPAAILHYAGYMTAPWLFYAKCQKRDRYYFYLKRTAFSGYVPPKDLRAWILRLLPYKMIPAVHRFLKKLHLR